MGSRQSTHGIIKIFCLKPVKTECVVSSWFSCSLIDQQQGAESKQELNRLHQGFAALWRSKFSHHGAPTDPPLFYLVGWLALCFVFPFFFRDLFICYPLSSLVLCCFLYQGSWMQIKALFHAVALFTGVCFCLCRLVLMNTSKTVKVSSLVRIILWYDEERRLEDGLFMLSSRAV